MRTTKHTLAIATVALMPVVLATPASAVCTRLGFSVNDYGKIEPARDAKNLLDKYIAKWTAEKGIKGYKTGPKSVKCELFLDVGLFDEYTCRAEASVCWEGPAVPGMPSAKPETVASPDTAAPDATAKPAKSKTATKTADPASTTTKADDKPKSTVTETGSTTKAETPTAPEKAPETPAADTSSGGSTPPAAQ